MKKSGMSLQAMSRTTGVNVDSLSRFVNMGKSLRLDRADVLARFFRLELRPTKGKSKARKGR